jgi:fatty-acyl-CoA synthase
MKDMLIRAGENVYPREIEEFLHGLPEVADAQVFGVPDPLYGEQVAAWIKLRPGQQMDETALRSACHGKIASYKVPYYVRFVEGYPVTASGKVQKFKMRATEIADRGLSA